MTLVLKNMKVFRFRYDDATGRERVAVLRRGQSTAHLNLSSNSEFYLRHLIVGVGGEPMPLFEDVTPAAVAAPVAVKAAPVVAEVAEIAEAPEAAEVAEVAEVAEIAEAVEALSAPVITKKARPKASAKKPSSKS